MTNSEFAQRCWSSRAKCRPGGACQSACVPQPHSPPVRRGSAARRGTAHAHGCWSRSAWVGPGLALEEAMAWASSLRRTQRTCCEGVHGCPLSVVSRVRLRLAAQAGRGATSCRVRRGACCCLLLFVPPEGFVVLYAKPRLALPLGRPSCLVGQDGDDERDDEEYDDERGDGRDERAVRALPLAS